MLHDSQAKQAVVDTLKPKEEKQSAFRETVQKREAEYTKMPAPRRQGWSMDFKDKSACLSSKRLQSSKSKTLQSIPSRK